MVQKKTMGKEESFVRGCVWREFVGMRLKVNQEIFTVHAELGLG